MLAVVAATAAVVLKRRVFPHLSINNDEAINAFFADTLTRGRLFAPTAGEPDAFRPWLAATSGDHYVLKYTPVVPALVAASLMLTGGLGLFLAVVAAADVGVSYLLARELLRDRAEALVATVLVALSPLVLLHSALLLSYLPTLVLLQGFAWAVLRGTSGTKPRLLAVGGVALGLAAFIRPFDALVFATPLLAWAVLQWRRGRIQPAGIAWFVGAGAVPIAAFAAFNAAASGHPLRLPFSMLEPTDTMGFGARRFYPTDTMRQFGLSEGVSGVLRHGLLLNRWVAGGTILIVLAAVTLLRRRIDGRTWALVAGGGLIPLSYVFFWGPWNATVLWGGTRYVGPFYFMAVVVPLALCGARGLVDLHRWRRAAGTVVAAGMAVVTAATAVVTVRDNIDLTGRDEALHRLVKGRGARQLVFVSPPAPFLMHPSAVVRNRSDLGGPVVYAIERGAEDLDLVRRFPDRTPYRLRFDDTGPPVPDEAMWGRLEQLRLLSGERLELRLIPRVAAGSGSAVVEVVAAGTRTAYLAPSGSAELRLVVTAGGAMLEGLTASTSSMEPTTDVIEVRVLRPSGATGPPADAGHRLPFRRTGSSVELLAPAGPTWTTGPVTPALLEISV